MLRPLLAAHGLPAFVHDWSWPPDADAAWEAFLDACRPVSWNDFAHLNFATGRAFQDFSVALVVGAFGPLLGLKVTACGLVLAASSGAFLFAKRTGATSPVAAAAALVYAASPVVANQFAAGHIGVLFGYAMLPFVATCGWELARGGDRRLAVLGLLVAVQFSIAQPQFAIFDAIVLAALVPFAIDARGRLAVVAAALLATIASPFGVALALFAHPLAAFGSDRTNLLYEQANSGAFWMSHIGASYVRAYDTGAGAAAIWLRALGGLALWGIALWNAFARRRALALLAVAIGAAWICAGVNGPLWFALSAAFVHVPQLALFRELYHFSAPLLLALAALIGFTRGPRATLAVGAAAVLFSLPALTGAVWDRATSYDPREIATIARIAGADRGDGYVLYWPILQPLGARLETSGADPDAFAIGRHPSLAEFSFGQPLSQIDALLCDPRTDAQSLLARFGIRYVVMRPQWRSFYRETLEPSLRGMVAGHASAPCAAVRVLSRLRTVWAGPTHRLLRIEDPVDRRLAAPTAPLYRLDVERPFVPSALSPDPRSAWVDAGHWQWWDSAFLGPVDPGIFAVGRTSFALPPHSGSAYLVLDAPAGASLEGDKHRPIVPARGYRTLAIPEGTTRIVTTGPTVLTGFAKDRQATARRAPALAPPPSLGVWTTLGWVVQIAFWIAGAIAPVLLAARGLAAIRATRT